MSIPIPPHPLEAMGRHPAITLAGLALVLFVVLPIAVYQMHLVDQRMEAKRIAARDAWIEDCLRPVDECARSWDEIATLRRLYLERQP